MELHHQAATPYLGTASGTVAVILRDVLSATLRAQRRFLGVLCFPFIRVFAGSGLGSMLICRAEGLRQAGRQGAVFLT